MCIALLTTAHPKYALIILDNRDEFILRPTSRPHWWTTNDAPATNGHGAPNNGTGAAKKPQRILSSRDLLRPEQGTWLGITAAGHFAVLTNYRELDPTTGAPSVFGAKSRGGMATAWLGDASGRSAGAFVEAMIAEGGTQGVGGFSLICGKLRKRRGAGDDALDPLAILSNKAAHPEQIPWICGTRGEVVGLSNAAWDNPTEWPKVAKGKAALEKVVAEAVAEDLGEGELQGRLLRLLDQDDLPKAPGLAFEDQLKTLQESIFIPLIGDQQHKDDMAAWAAKTNEDGRARPEEVNSSPEPAPKAPQAFSMGMYGTQRQTVILVDWDGNVTYTERALFDANGQAIEKGKGDETFRFAIEGWEQS